MARARGIVRGRRDGLPCPARHRGRGQSVGRRTFFLNIAMEAMAHLPSGND